MADLEKKDKKKKDEKKKKKSGTVKDEDPGSPSSRMLSPRGKRMSVRYDVERYSVEYFSAILKDVKEKCEKKMKVKSSAKDNFTQACESAYQNWSNMMANEQWLDELLQDKKAAKKDIEEAKRISEEAMKVNTKCKKYALKMALNIFEGLDGDKMSDIEDRLVKGAIIAQATPEGLAAFADQGREYEKLLKKLFGDPELMKEMLRHGGPKKYSYGKAMKIYTECLGDDVDGDEEDPWVVVNKKIALACALELCEGVRHFDVADEIDPVARYKHFEQAHRKGELDPAFPHFSVWEMRQIVNCDAPNDQMKWCRDMVMNYCPHITCITNPKLVYTYILDTDVRIRPPRWTASPRTYQMILAGGGNASVNSWFGRFILQSFGLPAWGTVFRRQQGYTRWTPEGWEAMNGADWETATWKGKAAKDFKIETEARNKAPPSEYFRKLVYLQCLADVVDGNPAAIPEEEKDVLHPDRLWRSMSIISMELLFATQPEKKKSFERKGEGLVTTNCEKYLEAYEIDKPDKEIKVDVTAGKVTIPASRHIGVQGQLLVLASFGGGQQLNIFADGLVEYELPDDAPTKMYKVTLEVCTVSDKQSPLVLKCGNDLDNEITIEIPYTIGEWKKTEPVQIEAGPGTVLSFSRPKNSLGLAIKKIKLS